MQPEHVTLISNIVKHLQFLVDEMLNIDLNSKHKYCNYLIGHINNSQQIFLKKNNVELKYFYQYYTSLLTQQTVKISTSIKDKTIYNFLDKLSDFNKPVNISKELDSLFTSFEESKNKVVLPYLELLDNLKQAVDEKATISVNIENILNELPQNIHPDDDNMLVTCYRQLNNNFCLESAFNLENFQQQMIKKVNNSQYSTEVLDLLCFPYPSSISIESLAILSELDKSAISHLDILQKNNLINLTENHKDKLESYVGKLQQNYLPNTQIMQKTKQLCFTVNNSLEIKQILNWQAINNLRSQSNIALLIKAKINDLTVDAIQEINSISLDITKTLQSHQKYLNTKISDSSNQQWTSLRNSLIQQAQPLMPTLLTNQGLKQQWYNTRDILDKSLTSPELFDQAKQLCVALTTELNKALDQQQLSKILHDVITQNVDNNKINQLNKQLLTYKNIIESLPISSLNLKAIKTSFLDKLAVLGNIKTNKVIERFVQQKLLNQDELEDTIVGCNNLINKEIKALNNVIKGDTSILESLESLNKTVTTSIEKITLKKLLAIDDKLQQYLQSKLQKIINLNNPQTQMLTNLVLTDLDLISQPIISQLKQIQTLDSNNQLYKQLQNTISDILELPQNRQEIIQDYTQNYLNNFDSVDIAKNIVNKVTGYSKKLDNKVKQLKSNILNKIKQQEIVNKTKTAINNLLEVSIYRCDQLRQVITLEENQQLNPINIILQGIFEKCIDISTLIAAKINQINAESAQAGTNPITTATTTTLCSFGVGPSNYLSTRVNVLVGNKPGANILDSNPFINHLPFPGCTNPANPTAAASFYIPPYVCIPAGAPYIPTKPNIILQKAPINVLNSKSFCQTAVGGIIQFIAPGQIKGFVK